jgi:hypothetical protein
MRQQLSPQARRDKAARDNAYSRGLPYKGKSTAEFKRKEKKAHAQRERRKSPVEAIGQDYDHKRQRFVSVKSNRGNEGIGTKHESGARYNTN